MKSTNGSTLNQYIATLIINIPMLYCGCNIGWLSPTILKLQSSDSPSGHPMSDETLSWISASMGLGALAATPVFGYMADAFGRKFAILGISAPALISWLLILCYPAAWSLLLSRILIGFSAGGALILIPMYVVETSEPKCRGALGILLTFVYMLGVVLGYLSGGLLNYQLSVAVFVLLPVLHILIFIWLPETPVFLVKTGRIEEATKALAWFRSLSTKDVLIYSEIEQMRLENKNVDASKITFRQIVQNRSSRKGLILLFILLTIQGWSGGYLITNYLDLIFTAAFKGTAAGESASIFVKILLSNTGSSVFVGLVMLFGSFMGIYFVEKFGRKPLLIGSFACLAACLASLGVWFYFKEFHPEVAIPGWLPITATSICVFGHVSGIASVPWVIMSEVFSFEVRSALSVIVLMWVWILAFVQLKAFSPLIHLIGIHNLLWSCSLANFVGIFYTVLFIPETKGRTLEEIAQRLENNHYKFENVNSS